MRLIFTTSYSTRAHTETFAMDEQPSLFIVSGPPHGAVALCVCDDLHTALAHLERSVCRAYGCASLSEAMYHGWVERTPLAQCTTPVVLGIECCHVADRRWTLQRVAFV